MLIAGDMPIVNNIRLPRGQGIKVVAIRDVTNQSYVCINHVIYLKLIYSTPTTLLSYLVVLHATS